MQSKNHKPVAAKDRIDLPYSRNTVFCRAFVYFGKDLLMVTGSESDILDYLEKNFASKIYLMVLHKCPLFKENAKDNLNLFHLPQTIKDAGVQIVIQRRDKNHPDIDFPIYENFNPNHYYRFVGLNSNKREGCHKILISSFKRLPRMVPQVVVQWLQSIFEDKFPEVMAYPQNIPCPNEMFDHNDDLDGLKSLIDPSANDFGNILDDLDNRPDETLASFY